MEGQKAPTKSENDNQINSNRVNGRVISPQEVRARKESVKYLVNHQAPTASKRGRASATNWLGNELPQTLNAKTVSANKMIESNNLLI